MSDAEKNKQLLRELRQASQLRALPLPGQEYERPSPITGFAVRELTLALDPPSADPEDFMAAAGGFPSQAMGPTFLSYGTPVAEGGIVVEEAESFIFGSDGTLYNNQYCFLLGFEDGQVVTVREYNDSHHAALVFGQHGGWGDLQPPTGPRRLQQPIGGDHSPRPPATEFEPIFEVVDELTLPPAMLADVSPSTTPPPATGNKELVRALRHARAAGDQATVDSCFGEGYRHFIAGEAPFGWDRLPLQEVYAPLVAHLASPLTTRYGPLLSDGDTVVEEMEVFAQLDDGTVYHNWHCLLHVIRDGKIVQTREYLDTRHVWIVLARWADWATTPVPVRTRPRRSNLPGIAWTSQIPTMFLDLERWQPYAIQFE